MPPTELHTPTARSDSLAAGGHHNTALPSLQAPGYPVIFELHPASTYWCFADVVVGERTSAVRMEGDEWLEAFGK
ncbi:hypothetical protein AYO38_11475 [bacterium SCGC AG-212-C10]|nr:hypothetical protein AYO38_11475 [bacterium SCGC AG-212-C10]